MEIILIIGGLYLLFAGSAKKGTAEPKQSTNMPTSKIPISNESWKLLKKFAESHGFTVTSTTGGKHNVGSKHALGRAVDVRTHDKSSAECNKLITEAKAQGITVRDERVRPKGQPVWSGSHIHLEV